MVYNRDWVKDARGTTVVDIDLEPLKRGLRVQFPQLSEHRLKQLAANVMRSLGPSRRTGCSGGGLLEIATAIRDFTWESEKDDGSVSQRESEERSFEIAKYITDIMIGRMPDAC